MIIVLAMKDDKFKATFAYACNSKAPNEEIARKVAEDIDSLGYGRVILRTDNDSSIKKLQAMVIKVRIEETVPQNTPTYSSQSGGMAEHAVQAITGQTRVMKIALEQRLGGKWRLNVQ